MKRNDVRALHDKDLAELRQQLSELETSIVTARMERSAGKLDNPAKVKNLQEDIARVKTVMREKELTTKVA